MGLLYAGVTDTPKEQNCPIGNLRKPPMGFPALLGFKRTGDPVQPVAPPPREGYEPTEC